MPYHSPMAVELIYLDHAASTPMYPEVRDAMLSWLGGHVGNPSGAHRAARRARQAIDDARDVVSRLLGVPDGDVVFTAGGTEADNLAVFGRRAHTPGTVVTSAVEHPAVAAAAGRGPHVELAVDQRGVVVVDGLAVDDDVTLWSVMAVNNEVGAVQPLDALSERCRERRPGVVLHTDAVQAVPWLDCRPIGAVVDMMSIAGHKFGGPMGVGALTCGRSVIDPVVVGGGQERELRSGTHNVAGIVGMAAALQLTHARRDATVARVSALRDGFVDALRDAVTDVVETGVDPEVGGSGDRSHKVAGNAHVCVGGVESEALLFLLDREGVAASAASSCASGAQQASGVLAAMGVPASWARGALRVSLGWDTTESDCTRAVEVIAGAVERLRGAS